MGASEDSLGKGLGRRGMYYLAAAVSDFFVPRARMVCLLFLQRTFSLVSMYDLGSRIALMLRLFLFYSQSI